MSRTAKRPYYVASISTERNLATRRGLSFLNLWQTACTIAFNRLTADGQTATVEVYQEQPDGNIKVIGRWLCSINPKTGSRKAEYQGKAPDNSL